MKQQLLFLQQQMIDFEEKLNALIRMAKLSGVGHKKALEVAQDWDRILKHFNEIQQQVTPVEALEVIIPKKIFTPGLVTKWQMWKDYLAEQHNFYIKSRMEIMSLKRLLDIADNDAQKAGDILEFAMATGYRNFFNPDKKDNKEKVLKYEDASDKY